MTGTLTLPLIQLINSKSYPELDPSLSIQFNKISPAPKASQALTNSTAPKSVTSRPPLAVVAYQMYSSPFGPGTSALMVSFLVSEGEATYCLFGSTEITTAWTP
ncbi:hypothetical protein WICPIJ_005603 [Wickerhamomyces pijperi]|uniref:Uncharacterized protein n=1 Tax=Wickerhamomyces pijperi TaxID=599730 RepID=A0A9P8TLP4_WICPI|nr:hypothetical protein WICPIJ_005603 [Wickerhamomyces pijperi]